MAEFVEVINKSTEICKHYFGKKECSECPLSSWKNKHNIRCVELRIDYPEEFENIVMSWKEPIDWSTVAVDTKIWVRDFEYEYWSKRHFAKYEDGKVYAFENGATSWTTRANNVIGWNCAKLAEEGE